MKRKLRSLSNRRVWNMKTKVQYDDLEWNEMRKVFPKTPGEYYVWMPHSVYDKLCVRSWNGKEWSSNGKYIKQWAEK